MQGREKKNIPAELPDNSYKVMIKAINVESGSIKLALAGIDGQDNRYAGKELLAVEISVKPLINVLWLGTILLVLGFLLALYQVTKRKPKTT
jgi:cytochrome c biogenesis factor